jgi:hypothetical protein
MFAFFRHRQSGDTKYTAKLTLNELESFIEQVDDLPCIIKEAALIKVCVPFMPRAQ